MSAPSTQMLPSVQMPSQPSMQGLQFDPTQLVDIQLPDAISLWPIAPGWWLLLGLIGIFLILIIYLIKRKPTIPAPTSKELKSEAMIELNSIKENYKSHQLSHSDEEFNRHTHETVRQLSIFLRRYALSLYQRDDVASLTDEQWLILLDELIVQESDSNLSSKAKYGPFSDHFSELLTQVPYQSNQKKIDEQKLSDLFAASEELILNSFKRFSLSKLNTKEKDKIKTVEKVENQHV